VSVVQSPMLPSIPTRSPLILVVVALMLASAVSLGVVFAIDYTDQSFRTPSEVMSELRIPVLAAVPMHYDGNRLHGSNGHGNGHGRGDNNDSSMSDDHFEPTTTGTIIEERG